MAKNVASGNDRVAIQVGQVLSSKAPKDSTPKDTGPVTTTNTRSGNARVGRQVDEIHGGLNL